MTTVRPFPANIYTQKAIRQGQTIGRKLVSMTSGARRGPGLVASMTASAEGHRVVTTEQRLSGKNLNGERTAHGTARTIRDLPVTDRYQGQSGPNAGRVR
jgi:hypothetical protein